MMTWCILKRQCLFGGQLLLDFEINHVSIPWASLAFEFGVQASPQGCWKPCIKLCSFLWSQAPGLETKGNLLKFKWNCCRFCQVAWSGESPFLVLCLEQSAFAQSKSFSVWLEEAIGARPVLRLPHTQQVWAFTCLLKGLTEHHHGGRNPALQPREWKGCSDLGHP